MRHLGSSGLLVSELSLRIGGEDAASSAEGAVGGAVDLALDRGVNLFLADVAAEGALGRALGGRRDEVIVAAEVQAPAHPRGRLSRNNLIASCEDSLRRLGSDWIDLYRLPAFDPGTPLEETIRALDDLVSSGKIRYVGVSRFASWQLMKAVGIAETRGWPRVVASEVRYSLVARDAEFDHFALGRAEGIGQLVRDAGSLAGAGASLEGAVAEVAAGLGASTRQVLINWVRDDSAVSSVILERLDRSSLADQLDASTWELDEEQVGRLTDASAGRIPYPQWHQYKYAVDRPVGPNRIALVPPLREGF